MSNGVLKADYIVPPASGKQPQVLVMLLHGVGANGADLLSLAEAWRSLLPDAVFILPNAPDPYDGGFPHCYQWFSLEGITPENRLERVTRPGPILNAFIDEQLAHYRFTDRQLAIVGFSQGTIMALFVALRRLNPCAGLLGYSGRLAGPDSIDPVLSRPRCLLIHGTRDEVIPVEELYAAENALKSHQVPVIAIADPGIPHAISPNAEALGGRFLQTCLSTEPVSDQDTFVTGMSPVIAGYRLSAP